MFRNYDDWKAHNPADEEWDSRTDEEIEEEEMRKAQRSRWAHESQAYCPVRQIDDDELPF